MNDEILTVTELKILISQEEEAIRVKRQSLKYHEDLLKDLRQRLNNFVVDGLRLQVREFIEGAKSNRIFLRRMVGQAQLWSKTYGTPIGQAYLMYYSCGCEVVMSVSEDEALEICRRSAAYSVDCSDYINSNRSGEID